MNNIPLFEPFITRTEICAVVQALKSKKLSRGPLVTEFEERFAKMTRRKFAVAVNSGTSGLDICLRALGIKANDEVITTAYSFIASTNCILYQGARPVFCDINNHTGLIDLKSVKSHISNKTKAILPVDIFGQPCDLSEIKKLGVPIIVDSCESFGAPVQSGALANVYGFYPNKQITTGEGGIIVTDDENFAKKLRSLRNQGFKNSANYLQEIEIGFNFRLSDINAALGIAQLKNANKILSLRKRAANLYDKLLKPIPDVKSLLDVHSDKISFFNYPILCKTEKIRTGIINEFTNQGIEYTLAFPPLHYFKYIQNATGYKQTDFPETEKLANTVLCLPFFSKISARQIRAVVKAIKQGIQNAKN